MFGLDPMGTAIVLPLAPMVLVIALWMVSSRRKGKNPKGGRYKSDLRMLLGFLSITLAVLFLPNPYNVYAGNGVDNTAVMVFSAIALGFLTMAVFIFRAYRKGLP